MLRVGGVIQSIQVDASYTPDVWDAMLPSRRPDSALILGLGGGTVAALLTQRWGPLPIIGVECDADVVRLARRELGLAAFENVTIITEDAFRYVRQCVRQFDVICIDLYTAGKIAHGVVGGGFLRDVSRILAPGGTAAVNLWHGAQLADQLRRLGRGLEIIRLVEADENLIAHCTHPTNPLLSTD